MLGTWDTLNKNLLIVLLIFKSIFLYVCMEFLSKQAIQQSTTKSIQLMSPKLELGINPVTEETWKEFPPSVMLRGHRCWVRQHLLHLISSIEIPPSPRPYHGQIQGTDVCIKKISLELVWLFIQFLPCHPDLGYVQQSPNNKLECTNFSLWKRWRRGEMAIHEECWREDLPFMRSGTREIHFPQREKFFSQLWIHNPFFCF